MVISAICLPRAIGRLVLAIGQEHLMVLAIITSIFLMALLAVLHLPGCSTHPAFQNPNIEDKLALGKVVKLLLVLNTYYKENLC